MYCSISMWWWGSSHPTCPLPSDCTTLTLLSHPTAHKYIQYILYVIIYYNVLIYNKYYYCYIIVIIGIIIIIHYIILIYYHTILYMQCYIINFILFTALCTTSYLDIDTDNSKFNYMYCSTLPVVQVVLQGSFAVLGAVEDQVSISAVEPSVQTLTNRNQLHVLHSPHLKPRPLTCTLKLRMEHHDVTCRGRSHTPEQHDVPAGAGLLTCKWWLIRRCWQQLQSVVLFYWELFLFCSFKLFVFIIYKLCRENWNVSSVSLMSCSSFTGINSRVTHLLQHRTSLLLLLREAGSASPSQSVSQSDKQTVSGCFQWIREDL